MANSAIQFTWRHVHRENTVENEHKHDAIEVVYYIRGEGTCTVGGQEYPYEAGSVCYIPQGVLHSEYHRTETEVLFFAFHAANDPLTALPTCMFLDKKERLLRLCTRIERENRNQPPHYRRMINALIDEFLIYLARSEVGGRAKKDELPKIIEETCAYTRLNSHMNLSAMDIAKRNGYSYDYFRHNFKKYCGTGLKEFILNERKNKIIEYLLYSDKSIKEIAEVCNFGDVQTLSKCFKQLTGGQPQTLCGVVIGIGGELTLRRGLTVRELTLRTESTERTLFWDTEKPSPDGRYDRDRLHRGEHRRRL